MVRGQQRFEGSGDLTTAAIWGQQQSEGSSDLRAAAIGRLRRSGGFSDVRAAAIWGHRRCEGSSDLGDLVLEHQGTQIHIVYLYVCQNRTCLWTLRTAASGEEICRAGSVRQRIDRGVNHTPGGIPPATNSDPGGVLDLNSPERCKRRESMAKTGSSTLPLETLFSSRSTCHAQVHRCQPDVYSRRILPGGACMT